MKVLQSGKDKIFNGGGILPADADFQNLKQGLEINGNFYKVFGGGV